jgi:hypothetical protein
VTNGANMNIRNNTIQNMTNTYEGTGAGYTQGIKVSTGTDSLTGNYISNLKNASPQTGNVTSTSASVIGIQQSTSASGNLIANNTIRNLMNTNAGSTAVGVLGIQTSSSSTSVVSGNTIYNLTVASSSQDAFIYGIAQNGAANHLTANNMVSLGLDTNNAAMLLTPTIAGVYKNSTGKMNLINNTVKIQGDGIGSGIGNTYAFRRNTTGVDSLINNILINTRNNATTGGGHYVINLNNTTTLTSDYNIVQAIPFIGDTLFSSNGISYLTLFDWTTFSGTDLHSKDTTITLVSASNLHLDPTMYGVKTLKGVLVADVVSDIDGDSRSVIPYIGADEISAFPLPVVLVSFNATTKSSDVVLAWITASELNNKGFEVYRSIDGKDFEPIGFVKGKMNASTLTNYGYTDDNAFGVTAAQTIYYKLKQIDNDNRYAFSKTVSVSKLNQFELSKPIVFPNPFKETLTIQLNNSTNAKAVVKIMDITGKEIVSRHIDLVKGAMSVDIDTDNLHQGVYVVSIDIQGGEKTVLKMVKQ